MARQEPILNNNLEQGEIKTLDKQEIVYPHITLPYKGRRTG